MVPLATEAAEAAREAASKGAVDHRVVVADAPNAYPCRHCLQWAKPGERMILFPHSAIPGGHPYSEVGPIFVHADKCGRYDAVDEYPAEFRNGRVFRAYNSQFDILSAEVGNGSDPEAVIEKLMQNPEAVFVDVRSVTHGCYTFRMERI